MGSGDDKDDEKLQRVVDARMRLKARFLEEQAKSPSLADAKPQGTGPANRHGMPQLPVGQSITKGWPVLDLGVKPAIALADWRIVVDGAVERRVELDWHGFLALPQAEDVSDFHCVT